MSEALWNTVTTIFSATTLLSLIVMAVFTAMIKAYLKHCRRQPPLIAGKYKQLIFAPTLSWPMFVVLTAMFFLSIRVMIEPPRGSTTAMWIILFIIALFSLIPLYALYSRFFVVIGWDNRLLRLYAFPIKDSFHEWRNIEHISTGNYNYDHTSRLRFTGHAPLKISYLYHGHDALLSEAQKHLAANKQWKGSDHD